MRKECNQQRERFAMYLTRACSLFLLAFSISAQSKSELLTFSRPVVSGQLQTPNSYDFLDNIIRSSNRGLSGAEGNSDDLFGFSVASSGEFLIVGACTDSVASAEKQGAAYIFKRVDNQWVQTSKLLPAELKSETYFGCDVAIEGNTAVVGAPAEGFGKAYVYELKLGDWVNTDILTNTNGKSFDQFGAAVEVSGDTIVVGAPQHRSLDELIVGAAYIFKKKNDTWHHSNRVLSVDPVQGAGFGSVVAIENQFVFVGSPEREFSKVEIFSSVNGVVELVGTLQSPRIQSWDRFGSAIAVSNSTIVVSAPSTDAVNLIDKGAAYVYTKTNSAWKFAAEIANTEALSNDLFGISVDVHGDEILVGAPGVDINGVDSLGKAFLFERNGNQWSQTLALVNSGGKPYEEFGGSVVLTNFGAVSAARRSLVGLNKNQGKVIAYDRLNGISGASQEISTGFNSRPHYFGASIAISGQFAVVGASLLDSPLGKETGAAFVFQKNGTGWTEFAKLSAPKPGAGDRFGSGVAIFGDRIVIGAPFADSQPGNNSGRAHVFILRNNAWILESTLLPSGSGGLFGVSVAIEGDSIVVGAPRSKVGANVQQGSVDTFERIQSNWILSSTLAAAAGRENDQFGSSVAISNGTIAIGAWLDDSASSLDVGSAYVFVNDSNVWTEQAKIVPQSGLSECNFGNSIALTENTLVVGGFRCRSGTLEQKGGAFVFSRTDTSWRQTASLIHSGGSRYDQFGVSVAIKGSKIVVGCWRCNVMQDLDRGAAFLFELNGVNWQIQRKLVGRSTNANSIFGASVAMSGNTLMIGAPFADGMPPFGNGEEGTVSFLDFTDFVFAADFE